MIAVVPPSGEMETSAGKRLIGSGSPSPVTSVTELPTCTARVRLFSAVWLVAGCSACTVKLVVPASVGVPWRSPSGSSVIPGGRSPPVTVHTSSLLGRLASRVSWYGWSTVAVGSSSVRMSRVGSLMTTV